MMTHSAGFPYPPVKRSSCRGPAHQMPGVAPRASKMLWADKWVIIIGPWHEYPT